MGKERKIFQAAYIQIKEHHQLVLLLLLRWISQFSSEKLVHDKTFVFVDNSTVIFFYIAFFYWFFYSIVKHCYCLKNCLGSYRYLETHTITLIQVSL
ncbi:unnamed protein product [Orchesella dallaii]|uniref:Uncharacterized protein n=1 Tax=Orchesella dallaii TaxID=48710 RepID=A0ABP1R4H8_9HEXA